MTAYQSMAALNKDYPERGVMSLEREMAYVKDAFDTYEQLGFRETFQSPYEEQREHNGLGFVVMGRVSYSKGEADIEALPMWHVLLSNGVMLDAYPEEICRCRVRGAAVLRGPLTICDNSCTEPVRIHPVRSATFEVWTPRDSFGAIIMFDKRQLWECYYFCFADSRGWVVQRKGVRLNMTVKDFERFFGRYMIRPLQKEGHFR